MGLELVSKDEIDRAILRLGDDLGGDQHHIAVGQIDRTGDELGEVVARFDLGQTRNGQNRHGIRHGVNRSPTRFGSRASLARALRTRLRGASSCRIAA